MELLNSTVMPLIITMNFWIDKDPIYIGAGCLNNYILLFFQNWFSLQNMNDSFKTCVQINMFIGIFLIYHKNDLSFPSLQNMITSLFLYDL